MSQNIVLEKAYKFALRIVQLYKYLTEVRKEFVMSKFVLSSGTQIGARIEIAQEAESRPGFIHEMNVALQKAVETRYWLRLLHSGGFLSQEEFDSILFDCEELIALLTSIVKSSKVSVKDRMK